MIRKIRKRIHSYGDYKIVKRFAFLPITCHERCDDRVDTETRWLQTVYIHQETATINSFEYRFFNMKFVTEEDYNIFLEEEAAIIAM